METFPMKVMIGIDPHKATHTAVAIDNNEVMLAELRVRACSSQVTRLTQWAVPFEDRVMGHRVRTRSRLPTRPAARRRG